MTDKAMDQVRAEFEAAMAEDLAICNPVFSDRKNTYQDYDIHCAWVMWLAAKEKYEPKCEAPTDNGIEEMDSLCGRYNAGEIGLSALVCYLWNAAYFIGKNEKTHPEGE